MNSEESVERCTFCAMLANGWQMRHTQSIKAATTAMKEWEKGNTGNPCPKCCMLSHRNHCGNSWKEERAEKQWKVHLACQVWRDDAALKLAIASCAWHGVPAWHVAHLLHTVIDAPIPHQKLAKRGFCSSHVTLQLDPKLTKVFVMTNAQVKAN